MELRPLGSTGIMVSPLGLGTVKLGRDRGVKYPASFRIPDDDEARALLAHAASLGINLLDTAPAYGTSETRLGELLTGQRDDWVIVTKAGEAFEEGVSNFDFSPEGVRASVERSLRRLKTDRLDCVLIHSDGRDREILSEMGTLQALQALKSEGKIRAVGASTKTVEGATLAVTLCDVVMLTYNPSSTDEGPAIDEAARRGTGVLIKKALASGHLNNLADPDADPVEASMRFVFRKRGVSAVVVGTINPSHLEHNARAVEAALAR